MHELEEDLRICETLALRTDQIVCQGNIGKRRRSARCQLLAKAIPIVEDLDATVIERDNAKRVAAYHDLQHRIQVASLLVVLFQKTEVTVSLKTIHGYVSGN